MDSTLLAQASWSPSSQLTEVYAGLGMIILLVLIAIWLIRTIRHKDNNTSIGRRLFNLVCGLFLFLIGYFFIPCAAVQSFTDIDLRDHKEGFFGTVTDVLGVWVFFAPDEKDFVYLGEKASGYYGDLSDGASGLYKSATEDSNSGSTVGSQSSVRTLTALSKLNVIALGTDVADSLDGDKSASQKKTNSNWLRILAILVGIVIFVGLPVRYWRAGKKTKAIIIALMGLAVAVIFWSHLLPDDWTTIFSGVWPLIIGILIVVFCWWRHKVVNKPMSWNNDPESEGDKGPQKHWFGIWGNILFHLCLFVSFGPFTGPLWNVKIPLIWEVLILIGFVVFKLFYTGERDDNVTGAERFGLARFKWWRDMSVITKVLIPGIILSILTIAFFLEIPVIIVVYTLLLPTFMVGATYAPHIRAMLVLTFMKKPIYNRFWLLGAKYLINGVWVTLLPLWLPFLNVILVPRSRWELEGIETVDIPTKDRSDDRTIHTGDADDAGIVVSIKGRALVQCFAPKYYLQMPAEDRSSDAATKAVLLRIFQDAIRSLTNQISYNQAKGEDWYECPIRRNDLPGYSTIDADHPMIQKYYNRAIMTIKVKAVTKWISIHIDDGSAEGADMMHPVQYDGEYVADNEVGVLIPATFAEYLDWKMFTSTGCQLIEFGIIDVTSEGLEDAELAVQIEQRLASKVKWTKQIMAGLGEGKGMEHAAEVSIFLDMMLNPKYQEDGAAVAIDRLIRMIGAQQLGPLFGIVDEGANLVTKLSTMFAAKS